MLSAEWSRIVPRHFLGALISFCLQVQNMRNEIMIRAERDMEFACISIDGTLKPAPYIYSSDASGSEC